MNWQAIGAVGEVAGALVVVLTLAYLAKQIRTSADATKALVRQGVSEASVRYLSLGIDARELREVTRKWGAEEDLAPHEEDLLVLSAHVNFRNFEGFYSNYRRRYFEESEWQAYENIILGNFLRNPFTRRMWDDWRRGPLEERGWSPEFARRVDSIRDRAQSLLDKKARGPGQAPSDSSGPEIGDGG